MSVEDADSSHRSLSRAAGRVVGLSSLLALAGCTDNACPEERITELETRRQELEFTLDDLDAEFGHEVTPLRTMQTYENQWTEGFSDSVIDQARSLNHDVRDAICIIKQMDGEFEGGHGTGWFIDEDLIVTNSHNVHVAGDIQDLRITTIDGTDLDDVTVLGFVENDAPDVALVRTNTYAHDASLSVGSEVTPEKDDILVQVGHPGSVGYWAASVGRFITTNEFPYRLPGGEATEYVELLTTVPGIEGVSGSPVFTLDGVLVGMTHGGRPVFERSAGDPAPVAPTRVFDTPMSPIMTSEHVGIAVVIRLLEEWQ